MTTTIAFATADGHIDSQSTTYSTARAGTGAFVLSTTATNVRVGQDKIGSTYHCWEGFFPFPYTFVSTDLVVTAYIDLFCSSATGTGVHRDVSMRLYGWEAGGLVSGDWQDYDELVAEVRVGVVGSAEGANQRHIYGQEGPINDQLLTSGPKQVVVYSSRMTGNNPPAGAEYNDFSSIEVAGTAQDACLVYSSFPIHTLVRVANCHVQLSDGRHVWIDADSGGAVPTMNLKLQDPPAAATSIATSLLNGTRDMGSSNQSLQQYTLVRDASDNIYWMGHAGGGANTLNVVCWKKTGASTWVEQGEKQADMPAAIGNPTINNLSAAWHNTGTGGTIVVVGGYDEVVTDGDPSGEMFYALLNCNYLLNGSGSLLRNSGDAYDAGLVTPYSSAGDWNVPVNSVGTCLDVVALDSLRGIVVCLDRTNELGESEPIGISRYKLNVGGGWFVDTNSATQDLWALKDAAAKARVLPISSTTFAVVTLDQDSGWGPTIYVLQNIDTSSTFTTLGSVLLHADPVASLPAPSAMDDATNWDAVYHPDANMIHFYYWDVADNRRLLRTGFDLDTYLPDKVVVQVATAVGAAGSFNHAIRVQHGALTESEVLISIANKTSGGVQSTIYVTDKLNVPPLAPTLVDKLNYDATTGSVFDWTFNDLNAGDTQSAYEFQIDNADTLASVVATGKITSAVSDRNVTGGTLTNGVNYRWRVRTWDFSDVVGAWSSYDFFSTTATGSTNITAPASDNPAGVVTDDYLVQWSVSGSTQAQYRVRVVASVSGVQLSDTGFVVSVATSATISGLLSGIEYRIEVTTRNAALVSTNTATRLITSSYSSPEIPILSVLPVPLEGHNLITVLNPPPGSFSPPVLDNFETDTSANYTPTGGALAWDAVQFHDGARSLKLTVSGSPTTARIFQNTSNDFPVIGGKAYTVRFWAFDTTTHTNLAGAVEWRDGAHTAISISTGTATAIAATTWELREATLIAPLTAQYAAFGPSLGASPPNGEVLHIDELEFLEATDQPEVSVNLVQRRKLGENDWVTIAELPLDGTYKDFHIGSGNTYEYQVVGVATGVGQSTSVTISVILELLGVWLHDPSQPADTIKNFVYGANQRGALRAARSQLTYFAGRRDPIADFAEHSDQVFSVTVDVAFGDEWQTKLDELYALEDSRQTLVYRDNRRRMSFGILGGITETDMPWGTQVSFDFTRVDYNEAVV